MNDADPSTSEDPAFLSRMLFEAREDLEMWADVVDQRHGYEEGQRQPSFKLRKLIERIDTYRRNAGWPMDGFGGES